MTDPHARQKRYRKRIKAKADSAKIMEAALAPELMAKSMMAKVFFLAQPDRGDVFSWLDDHSVEICEAIVAAIRIETQRAETLGSVHESRVNRPNTLVVNQHRNSEDNGEGQ